MEKYHPTLRSPHLASHEIKWDLPWVKLIHSDMKDLFLESEIHFSVEISFRWNIPLRWGVSRHISSHLYTLFVWINPKWYFHELRDVLRQNITKYCHSGWTFSMYKYELKIIWNYFKFMTYFSEIFKGNQLVIDVIKPNYSFKARVCYDESNKVIINRC